MFKAAIAFLIIPIAGIYTSYYLLGIIQAILTDITLAELCSMSYGELNRIFQEPNEVISTCNFIKQVSLLQTASTISLITSVAILALFKITSLYCGTDRNKNASIFPKLIPFTVLIIASQVLIQGLILAYLSYVVPSEIAGFYYPIISLLIGGGAAFGFFQVVSSLLTFFKKPEQIEKAILTNRENYPKLWSHVEAIANKIEARKPDNIIIGLQPTFYATSAEVKLVFEEEKIKGQTLFLSLPLMKLFNSEELDAVVGHELGHFKAKDTNYSTKFAPVYANLGKSIDNLSNTISGASALAKIPAIYVLSAMYETFATNIAAISREREFEADKVGCEASTKEGLVYSLAKVVTYSRLWNDTLLDNIKRLNNGRVTPNLSEVFRESSLYNIGKKDIDDIIDEVLPSIVQHPTDSHPPMAERYKNIDFDESQITREKIIAQGDASTIYIDNVEKLEEELTIMEHKYLVALGVVNIPEEANDDGLSNVIYSMAAAMIGADGKLEIDEVQVAEDMGIKILPDFDRVEFRRFIDNLKEIPKLEKVAEACKDFSDENKQIIYNYLEKIAYADDDLADDEKKILENLKEIWELK